MAGGLNLGGVTQGGLIKEAVRMYATLKLLCRTLQEISTAKTSMYGMVLVHVDGQKKRKRRQRHGMYALKYEGSVNLWPLPYMGRRRTTKRGSQAADRRPRRGGYRRRDARYTHRRP